MLDVYRLQKQTHRMRLEAETVNTVAQHITDIGYKTSHDDDVCKP